MNWHRNTKVYIGCSDREYIGRDREYIGRDREYIGRDRE